MPTLRELLAEHIRLTFTLRWLTIQLDPAHCEGAWACLEVCPREVFAAERGQNKVRLARPEACIACGACVLQCPTGALRLVPLKGGAR